MLLCSEPLRTELLRFLAAGFCAFAVDMAVYYSLISRFPRSFSKCVSFVTASLLAYVLNKYWTFDPPRKTHVQFAKFYALYFSTLAANVGVNKASLLLCPQAVFAAFIAASATSTVLNYAGQKWWVFR
ncbi:MAG: GtrA family protein [Elusimicrobiota bacterium]